MYSALMEGVFSVVEDLLLAPGDLFIGELTEKVTHAFGLFLFFNLEFLRLI